MIVESFAVPCSRLLAELRLDHLRVLEIMLGRLRVNISEFLQNGFLGPQFALDKRDTGTRPASPKPAGGCSPIRPRSLSNCWFREYVTSKPFRLGHSATKRTMLHTAEAKSAYKVRTWKVETCIACPHGVGLQPHQGLAASSRKFETTPKYRPERTADLVFYMRGCHRFPGGNYSTEKCASVGCRRGDFLPA